VILYLIIIERTIQNLQKDPPLIATVDHIRTTNSAIAEWTVRKV